MVIRDLVADGMAACGALLLTVAAALVYVPAGVAVLGISLILGSVAIAREDGR